MSDGDSDCLSPPNIFNYENERSIIAKGVVTGPNFQSTLNNLNFTNTSNMPRNFENRRYDDRFSQRSERSRYDRREHSPASLRNAPVSQPRRFDQSFYPGGMAQSSMMSHRAVSPTMSMRSMNSNVSVAADYILSALQSMQFNKYELRNIKDTCNQLMRGRIHKKYSKRQHHKQFLKGARRKSGDDSGEQGSDSSISSDDCRSTRTSATMHKGNNRYQDYRYRQSRQANGDTRSLRSVRTDFTDLRRTMRDSNMYRDCTDSFKQNSFKNMFSLGPRSLNGSMARNTTMNMSHVSRNTVMGPPQRPMGQRDRFKNSFLLPSQRFNGSVVTSIPEEIPRRRYQEEVPRDERLESPSPKYGKFRGFQKPATDLDSSNQEEIFNEVTILERTIQRTENEIRQKRNLNLDESLSSESKRSKLATPKKAKGKQTPIKTPKNPKKSEKKDEKIIKPKSPPKAAAMKDTETDFVFAKPKFPMKITQSKVQTKPAKNTKIDPTKATNEKPKESNQIGFKEKLIAKSKEPTIEEIIDKEKQLLAKEKDINDRSETTLQSAGDVSQRPSFMKRKLYTQTLDVTEVKNGSNESLSNSPSIHDTKEKSRIRKLVTNSHYLSRDVTNDESNLLDLIHKIVPPSQINQTQSVNRSSDPVVGSKKDMSQWNLKSKSAVDVGYLTDSITDEEIFNVGKKSEVRISKCTVVLKKVDPVIIKDAEKKPKTDIVVASPVPASKHVPVPTTTNNNCIIGKGKTPKKMVSVPAKRNVKSLLDSFWNCDSESDAPETPLKKPVAKPSINESTKNRRDSPTVNNVVKSTKAIETTGKINKSILNVTTNTSKKTPIRKVLAKTVKSVIGARLNDSHTVLKDIGDKLNNSKSLRIRAVKELKEKKAQTSKSLKPVDLEETLYDVIKKRRAKASFSSSLESSKENSKNVTIVQKVTKVTKKETEAVAEKPKLQPAKKANKKPVKENKLTKATKTTAKEALMAIPLSPIKAINRSINKLNKTSDKSSNVTAKKIVTKTIANKTTVTKDLNQSMITRRAAMKANLSRKSTSMQQMQPPPVKVQKPTVKKDKAPLRNKNNNVVREKEKPIFKRIVDGTLTESDASLVTPRKRGRPRKDAGVNAAKKQVSANKENENLERSFRARKNTTICACADDAPKANSAETKKTTQTTKRPQMQPERFAEPQLRSRRIESLAKSFMNTTANTTVSRRTRKRADQGDERAWGLGLTTATIGVVPRHCGTEELFNNTGLDDSKSVTIRSVASTSAMAQGRRPKFLHVF